MKDVLCIFVQTIKKMKRALQILMQEGIICSEQQLLPLK
jgi:hypothetical protein